MCFMALNKKKASKKVLTVFNQFLFVINAYKWSVYKIFIYLFRTALLVNIYKFFLLNFLLFDFVRICNFFLLHKFYRLLDLELFLNYWRYFCFILFNLVLWLLLKKKLCSNVASWTVLFLLKTYFHKIFIKTVNWLY